ncbi:hypothetical protein [Dokdonella sp.]|nr:hypothetical protein [Dokdonella sp.]
MEISIANRSVGQRCGASTEELVRADIDFMPDRNVRTSALWLA